MKIRTDFVTNSSSANFTVVFQLKNDRDEMVEYAVGDYDGDNPYEALFEPGLPVKELGLASPTERDGEILLDGTPLSQLQTLEELARHMLGLVRPTLYDDDIVALGQRFFVVGEPVRYESRDELTAAIERVGGRITGLDEATFVIYCDKGRFCECWPEGYSYDAMDEAEQHELDAAEDAVSDEIRRAAEAVWDFDANPDGPDLTLFTGERSGAWYQNQLAWAGWSLCLHGDDSIEDRFVPILSEEQFAFFDPFGPAGDGALSTMPGAVETLLRRCRQQGITRENLRVIGGKISVTPFGDSVWEVADYTDQWGVNVQTGELGCTGRQVTREAGSLEGEGAWLLDADTGWLDTVWWPFDGTPSSVPYEAVASGAVRRGKVRHLDLAGLDLSHVTSMAGMFRDFWDLQQLDLSGLDTSRVTDMTELFYKCRSLHSLRLEGLDTSQVTSMQEMFGSCASLRELSLAGICTERVTDMSLMFVHCSRLRSLDLSGLDTAQVTDMSDMFSYCTRLQSLELSGLDTSRVTSMRGMFERCKSLTSLDLSSFNTARVTDMYGMFLGCTSLASLDLSGFDTGRVTDMRRMFEGCASLERWSVPAGWPVHLDGAIPEPTSENDMWWSEREGAWLTVEQIRRRGPVADRFAARCEG